VTFPGVLVPVPILLPVLIEAQLYAVRSFLTLGPFFLERGATPVCGSVSPPPSRLLTHLSVLRQKTGGCSSASEHSFTHLALLTSTQTRPSQTRRSPGWTSPASRF